AFESSRDACLHARRTLGEISQIAISLPSSAFGVDGANQLFVVVGIGRLAAQRCAGAMDDWCCTAMLHRSGPDDVLQSTASTVHIETVVSYDFGCKQVVVSLLDERVLRSLKRISLRRRYLFPDGGKLRCSGLEVCEVFCPGKSLLSYKTRNRAHLTRHLIRAVGNASSISFSRRDCARPSTACFVFRRQCSQFFCNCLAQCAGCG